MRWKRQLIRWRADFFAGLAVALPIVLTLAIVTWIFNSVSGLTNTVLFFLPREITHENRGEGEMLWYWSLLALLITAVLLALLGRFARYFIGKKIIAMVDNIMRQLPLLNKIYVTVKQVNEALTSKRTAFKKVVLIEYPRPGCYSIGFIANEYHPEASEKIGKRAACVFLPTTPNPTSGYLLIVPEDQIKPMNMSISDGVKLIISLGSVVPEYRDEDSKALVENFSDRVPFSRPE